MMHLLTKLYRRLPLRRKQLVLFLFWGAACLIPIGIISGVILNRILISQQRKELLHTLDQASDQLSSQISQYNALSDYLFNDDDLTAVFRKQYTDDYYDMYLSLENTVMPSVLTYQFLNSDLRQIRFYTDNGLPLYKDTVYPLEDLENSSWHSAMRSDYTISWAVSDAGEIAAIRRIFLRGSGYTCYLVLLMNSKTFLNPLTAMLSDGSAVWLTESEQEEPDDRSPFYWQKGLMESDSLMEELILTEHLSNGWTIHYGITESHYQTYLRSMLKLMIIIAVTVVGAMLIGAYFIAGTIIKPVEKLTGRLTRRIQEHSRKPLYTSREDEVGVLTRSFNTLIQDVYESRLEADEYHLKVLYAQINPHFLYNALGAINNKAILARQDDISRMTLLLSEFYRTSLNHGNEITTISAEIQNIRSYIEIEQILYGDYFHVSFETKPGAEDWEMPNFILQPIVENAINHGLRNSGRPDRLLTISLQVTSGEAVFCISDNGVGIPDDILATLKAHESSGIGLSNIDKRLRLCFGEEYGLNIESTVGSGTSVTVRIPEKRPSHSPA